VPVEVADLQSLAEAQHTIQDFYIISRPAGDTNRKTDDVTRRKIGKALEGPDCESETLNQEPWSTQFELSLAAHLVMGGISLRLDEPDIVIQDGDLTIGIAAKRLVSQAKYQRRVSDAEKQIRRSGLPGVIAIGIDAYVNQFDLVNVGHDAQIQRFRLQVPDLLSKTKITEPLVAGLIYVGRTVEYFLNEGVPRFVFHHSRSYRLLQEVGERKTWLEQLDSALDLAQARLQQTVIGEIRFQLLG